MTGVIDQLLTSAPPPLVYLLVFLVPALEAGIFLGFVLPAKPRFCSAVPSQRSIA